MSPKTRPPTVSAKVKRSRFFGMSLDQAVATYLASVRPATKKAAPTRVKRA